MVDESKNDSVENQNGINTSNLRKGFKRSNGYDRHNYAKLRLFDAIIKLQNDGVVVNCSRLSAMLNKTSQNVSSRLRQLSIEYPYLKRKIDPNTTDGCVLMFELDKEGISVYHKLKERYEQGLDLNLRRKNPEKVVFYKDGKPI